MNPLIQKMIKSFKIAVAEQQIGPSSFLGALPIKSILLYSAH